jgi:peptidylprolyl isomerase
VAQVKKSDRVSINFTGKLADGTLIDSTYPDSEESSCEHDNCSHDHGPYEFTLGNGEFFPSIEEALIGMKVGDKKVVVIAAEDAFGNYDPENVYQVERSELPEGLVPEVGMELEVGDDEDDAYSVTIIHVDDKEITLDANHPLAGQELTYEFELVAIL